MRQLASCVLALALAPLAASQPHAGEVSLIRSERWSQVSEQTGQTYRIEVALPKAAKSDPKHPLPLIVVLDSDYAFALARNMVEHLSDRQRIPAAIVVGVGYPEGIEAIPTYRRHRTRDYTPTHDLDGQYGPEIMAHSGGGPAFYRYLRTELLPFLKARYAIDSQSLTLVGHSFGGLFATYVFAQADAPFQQFIIVSPSLWFDDRKLLSALAEEQAKPSARARRVFLAVGAMEAGMMTADLRRLHQVICQQPAAKAWRTEFADEHHDSVFPVALSHGLRLLSAESMPPTADSCDRQ